MDRTSFVRCSLAGRKDTDHRCHPDLPTLEDIEPRPSGDHSASFHLLHACKWNGPGYRNSTGTACTKHRFQRPLQVHKVHTSCCKHFSSYFLHRLGSPLYPSFTSLKVAFGLILPIPPLNKSQLEDAESQNNRPSGNMKFTTWCRMASLCV